MMTEKKQYPDLLTIDGQVISVHDEVYVCESAWSTRFTRRIVISINKQRRTLVLRDKEGQEIEATITQYIRKNNKWVRIYKDIGVLVKKLATEKIHNAKDDIKRFQERIAEQKSSIKHYRKVASMKNFGEVLELK